MPKQSRSKAEEKFARLKQRDKKAVPEWEKTQQEMTAKTARLRALRLAKEAADKEALETAEKVD